MVRPTRAIRKELALPTPHNPDSQYRDIKRTERVFNALFVPPKLQAALPYASKPKQQRKRGKASYLTKRAVVMEPEQRKAHTLVQQIQTVSKIKAKQEKAAAAKRHAAYAKKKAATAAKFSEATRLERKRRYKAEGIATAVRSAKAARKE